MIDRYRLAATAPGGVQLDVQQFRVKLSENWSPYVQGTLVCALPAPAVVASLDPRYGAPAVDVVIYRDFGDEGNRIAAWTAAAGAPSVKMSELTALGAGAASWATNTFAHHWNGGPVAGQSLTLHLPVDELSTDSRQGTLTLDVAGADIRLQDYAPALDTDVIGQTVRDSANSILKSAGLPPVSAAPPLQKLPPEWQAGESAHQVLTRWLDPVRFRLIVDEDGLARVIDRASSNPGPVVELTGVTELELRQRRRDWNDKVIIVWRWEEPDLEDPSVMVPWRNIEQYPMDTPGSKPLVVEMDAKYPGVGTAQALWQSASRKGEVHKYEMPLDLDRRPLDAITVNGREATISEVEFRFPDATLTVTTRER